MKCTKEVQTDHMRFLLRHADAEICGLLEQTIPPMDLARLGIFRVPMSRFQKKATRSVSTS